MLNDLKNPDIKFTDNEIENYRLRVDIARGHYGLDDDLNAKEDDYFVYKDKERLCKCFGNLIPKVIEVRDADEYYQYRDLMIENMNSNAVICRQNLIGIKWITKNPGRQWTASINPIIADPRDWYGRYYIPVLTGIPEEIETCLRLARLRSDWSILDDDVFNLILLYIMKFYADEAWNFVK